MILPASYSNGFAPRDGQPLYPGLWRGCVGAWDPGLGPTGLTLRDCSGFGRHGTMTNMDAAGDWVVSGGRYALEFDATNDHVTGLSPQNLALALSWSVWFRPVSGFNQLIGQGDGNGTGLYFSADTATGAYWYPVLGPLGTLRLGVWQHLCGTFDGLTAILYLNGRQIGATGSWGRSNSSTSLEIGRVNFGGTFYYDGNGRQIGDIRRYNRALSPIEVCLLASRRGIAYELAPRRRSSSAVAAFNRRRRLLLGASN